MSHLKVIEVHSYNDLIFDHYIQRKTSELQFAKKITLEVSIFHLIYILSMLILSDNKLL